MTPAGRAGLRIIGREGYEILIDQGIEKAETFAEMIRRHDDFELITAPELNILTYRYCPARVRAALAHATPEDAERINASLNRITRFIQKTQRERGKSFVSRTQLEPAQYNHYPCVVFRVVLANPLTTRQILTDILDEQAGIGSEDSIAGEKRALEASVDSVLETLSA